MRLIFKICLVLGNIVWTSQAIADDITSLTSTQADQSQVTLTIYNQDLALVRDIRNVRMPASTTALSFRDVSALMKPQTAMFQTVESQQSLQLLEQNFDYALLTPQSLLEKYVGQTVTVVKTHPVTGVETQETATILAARDGLILKIGDHIETGFSGRIIYPAASLSGFTDRPTLTARVRYSGPSDTRLALSYLTAGLQWKTDYVLALDASGQHLSLFAWVTLSNTSGTHYQNAKVQLVAGEVHSVRDAMQPKLMMMRSEAAMAEGNTINAENLLDYHLYTLPMTTTIKNQQNKQIALLSAKDIPVQKTLLLKGSETYYQNTYGEIQKKQPVQTWLSFDNRKASGLGMPLPKGIMRVYANDNPSSQAQGPFIGEDQIDHTAVNETVRLQLGNAFDVTSDRIQTDFKNLSKPNQTPVYESAYAITLHNAKKEAVTVTVQEPIHGDWTLLETSHAQDKTDAHQLGWQIRVPAESETTLRYRVKVKY